MKHFTIPIFIPELACPNRCIYCNQRIITGKQDIPQPNDITEIIDNHLKTISKENSQIEIGFFGGNFTAVDEKTQKELLSVALKYIKNGLVDSIRISTRPDYISEEKVNILKNFGVKTVELGVQSLDEHVLKQIQRGYTLQDVVNASKIIKNANLNLGMQMMVGLPSDTAEKSLQTAKLIVELGASETRIYPCMVIKDTVLAELYNQKKYKPLSINDAIEWIKPIMRLFEENNVKILRIGLHPIKEFIEHTAFLDGPFHVSFKELLLTDIWKDILNEKIDNRQLKHKKIIIEIPTHELNYAIGYNSSNKKFFEKWFSKVTFIPNNNLKERQINVCYC